MIQEGYYKLCLKKADEIAILFDKYIYPEMIKRGYIDSIERKKSWSDQKKGIDVIININGKEYKVDEKAKVTYINRPIEWVNTFVMEILSSGAGTPGWLLKVLPEFHKLFPDAKYDDHNYETEMFIIIHIIEADCNNWQELKWTDIKKLCFTIVTVQDIYDYLLNVGVTSKLLKEKAEKLNKEFPEEFEKICAAYNIKPEQFDDDFRHKLKRNRPIQGTSYVKKNGYAADGCYLCSSYKKNDIKGDPVNLVCTWFQTTEDPNSGVLSSRPNALSFVWDINEGLSEFENKLI